MKLAPIILLLLVAVGFAQLPTEETSPSLGWTKGAALWVNFDSAAGVDWSPNRNAVTILSNAAILSAAGTTGYLFLSNNLGQRAQIAHSASLGFGSNTAFTISMRANMLKDTAANQNWINKRASNTGNGYFVFYDSTISKIAFGVALTGGNACECVVTNGPTLFNNGLHRWTFVYRRNATCDTNSFAAFYDGSPQSLALQLSAISPTNNIDTTQPMQIGANPAGAAQFNGYVDEVIVWPFELTAQEIGFMGNF